MDRIAVGVDGITKSVEVWNEKSCSLIRGDDNRIEYPIEDGPITARWVKPEYLIDGYTAIYNTLFNEGIALIYPNVKMMKYFFTSDAGPGQNRCAHHGFRMIGSIPYCETDSTRVQKNQKLNCNFILWVMRCSEYNGAKSVARIANDPPDVGDWYYRGKFLSFDLTEKANIYQNNVFVRKVLPPYWTFCMNNKKPRNYQRLNYVQNVLLNGRHVPFICLPNNVIFMSIPKLRQLERKTITILPESFKEQYEPIIAVQDTSMVSGDSLLVAFNFDSILPSDNRKALKWRVTGNKMIDVVFGRLGNEAILYAKRNCNGSEQITFTAMDGMSEIICDTILVRVTENNRSIILSDLPETYYVSDNYPNPFNARTTIDISLPKRTFISLKIYNVFGHLVRTLQQEQVSGGKHRVSWDAKDDGGKDAPSGVYLLRIETDEFSQTRRMTLLK
jgi:hypothetical protein